jgi:antitoxin YefM
VKVTTITEFQADMAKMFDAIADDADELIVTRSGRESVVIMSQSAWDAWQTTAHLLRGRNGDILRRSIVELNAGHRESQDLIQDDLR